MTSKPIVTASATLLLGLGIVLNFMPQETASALGAAAGPGGTIPIQVLAAALLALGSLNWLSKGNPMGGIYSRPLAFADLVFFGIGALVLGRESMRGHATTAIVVAAIVLAIFALSFAWLMFFRDPVATSNESGRTAQDRER